MPQSNAPVSNEREALSKIAALDYANGAVNCAAYEAVKIARAALSQPSPAVPVFTYRGNSPEEVLALLDALDGYTYGTSFYAGVAPQPTAAVPDGRLHADGYFTWATHHQPWYGLDRGLPRDFYLAAPQPTEPAQPVEYHSQGQIRRFTLDANIDGMDHTTEFVLASDHDTLIADLEMNCDPAGMVAENGMLRDQTRQLAAMIDRLKLEREPAQPSTQALSAPDSERAAMAKTMTAAQVAKLLRQEAVCVSRMNVWQLDRAAELLEAQPSTQEGAGHADPIEDFEEGQWWVEELDAMVRSGTNDQKRAVAVVHHLLRAVRATPLPQPSDAPQQQGAMDAEHWAELHRLREAVRGPDGYATWQDAATAERIRRVKAERELAATQQPQPAEQGEDAARLDWLEKTGREFSWGEDYVRWIVTGTPARSLRANIDAARAAQGQKGGA